MKIRALTTSASAVAALLLFALAAYSADSPTPEASAGPAIHWEGWSPEVFARAKKENRLVILDLQAIWCHWCHVMEATTYRDPQVISLIGSKFIAVQVDQDSRPDLSNRYEDYGWPATIFFGSGGEELAKRAGYINPEEMRSLLAGLIAHPGAEASDEQAAPKKFPESPFLTNTQKADQEKKIVSSYDFKKGGWDTGHRLLDPPFIEYAMQRSRYLHDAQSARFEKMAKQWLRAQSNLLDPGWGGMYQYSVDSDWNEPHFEKIMSIQTDDMITYAHAYALWGDPKDLATAKGIDRFLQGFLTAPDGTFYTSQDADLVQGQHSAAYFALSDAARRRQGIPRVDTHVYARENGWAIDALTQLFAATGDASYLDRARKAAVKIETMRKRGDGGFSHAEHDAAGPFLGDTLAMSRAFLDLYAVTGEKSWLKKASEGASFIDRTFRAPTAGYLTAAGDAPGTAPEADENLQLARFANSLYQYTGNAAEQEIAKRAMRYLAAPEIYDRLYSRSGVLLADHELTTEPTHLTIVGHKDDPQAAELFKAALAFPAFYKRVEWWDQREGALPRGDVSYPELPRAAGFACGSGRCSRPAFSAAELKLRAEKLEK